MAYVAKADSAPSSSEEPRRFGPYEVLTPLATGGMAEVYVARVHGSLEPLYAIKRIKPEHAQERHLVQMFRDEALLAMQLLHPNVVQVLGVGEEADLPFLVMEYLNGLSLRTFMRRYEKAKNPVGAHLAMRIMRDVLDGLQYVHDAGLSIVHRDLKPENVFLTYTGEVKILDFGLARSSLRTVETAVGSIRGTLAYMAPEQVLRGPLDRRTDVFASGVILWELVTGKKFVSGPSVMRAMMRILYDPILAAKDIDPSIDPELSNIIARAMARDPNQRYSNAGEMRDALDALLARDGVVVTQDDVGAAVSLRPVEIRTSRSLLRVANSAMEPTESQTGLIASDVESNDATSVDSAPAESGELLHQNDEPTLELPTTARDFSPIAAMEVERRSSASQALGWRRLAGFFLGFSLIGGATYHLLQLSDVTEEAPVAHAISSATKQVRPGTVARSPIHGHKAIVVTLPGGAPGVTFPARGRSR